MLNGVIALYIFLIFVSIGLGLIPFFIAKSKGAIKFAISALGLCFIAGLLVGPIGSIPIAVLFTTLALICSPDRLRTLGEKEPDGIKDVAIFFAVLVVLVGVLVALAFKVGALG